MQLADARRLRIRSVCHGNAVLNAGISPVLVVVVLVELANVVWRIADDYENWRFLLTLDPLRVFGGHEAESALLPLRQLERIRQTKPGKRLVFARSLEVGVLDIHAGD